MDYIFRLCADSQQTQDVESWTNLKPTLLQRLVSAGLSKFILQFSTVNLFVVSRASACKVMSDCYIVPLYNVAQNQKAVFAYFTSKHILPFGFAEQYMKGVSAPL